MEPRYIRLKNYLKALDQMIENRVQQIIDQLETWNVENGYEQSQDN